MAESNRVILRDLGLQPYEPIWRDMQKFTDSRDKNTADEIWFLEHQPVFTQGQAGKAEHLLNTGDIPVVQVDRGGQVTYHGPGQLIIYLLLDLRRNSLGVRDVVTLMEQCLIELLASYGVEARAKPDAPGVYVQSSKIASLGLRVRRGCCFHGLALNLNLDKAPFMRINPCGYPGMEMVNLSDYVPEFDMAKAKASLVNAFVDKIGYTDISHETK